MSISRRKFMKSSAALSAAFLLKPGTFVLGQDSMWSNSAKTEVTPGQSRFYNRAMFEPYLGDTFSVRSGKQTINLKLVALTDLKTGSSRITTGRTNPTECFSLRFQASTRLPATARMHTLDHHALGSFNLFMSQSREGARFLQTAIVNHVV